MVVMLGVECTRACLSGAAASVLLKKTALLMNNLIVYYTAWLDCLVCLVVAMGVVEHYFIVVYCHLKLDIGNAWGGEWYCSTLKCSRPSSLWGSLTVQE